MQRTIHLEIDVNTNLKRRLPVHAAATALLVLILSLRAGAVNAQQQKLVGVITDRESGTPVVAARVTVLESGESTLTTGGGYFIFKSIDPGFYTLEIKMLGYARQIVMVKVSDRNGVITIELLRSGMAHAGRR